jgi:hypothetical protein
VAEVGVTLCVPDAHRGRDSWRVSTHLRADAAAVTAIVSGQHHERD